MSEKILIIEDERITAEDIKEMLQEVGYEVCKIATTFREAVKIAEKEKPDLAVVDIALGKDRTGGIRAAEEISSKLQIPIIYLTAYSDSKTFEEAKISEPFTYLTKPINENELKLNVRIALYKSKAEKELRRLNIEKDEAIKTLERSESTMKAIFSSMVDLIFVVDGQGRFVFYNSPEKQLYLKPEEFLGRTTSEVLPPDISSKFKEAFKKNKKGEIADYQYELKISGKKGWFSARQSPIFIGKKFNGAVAVIRNITQIKETEERYTNLFNRVPIGLYRTSPSGEITDANPAFLEILGYSTLEELKKRNAYELYQEQKNREKWKKLLEKQGILIMETQLRRRDGKIIWVKEFARAIRNGTGEVDHYEGSIQDITDRKKLEEELRRNINSIRKLFEETVSTLGSIVKIRDPYTAAHQRRVTELAVEIAKEMGLDERRIEAIRIAGLLHDIGKLAVPAEILAKPTKLTKQEFMLIKSHTEVGYNILKEIDFPWPVAEIVLQHHERMNGSGYPKGLKNGEILLEARILGVADVVEAMSSHRPYRPALGIKKALEEIKENRGKLYDPEAVDACLRVFEKGTVKWESSV